MPQMSPLMWVNLFIYFLLLIVLFIIILYFLVQYELIFLNKIKGKLNYFFYKWLI